MSTVSFVGVGKAFRDGTRAVDNLDLEVVDGEFMVLVGPSGCGKTTALRMCAGLEDVSEGEIRIDGTVVNNLEPRKRDIAMVFQNYALYPSMSVFENIAFPLRSRRAPRAEIRTRVAEVAQMLGIESLLRRRPGQLSGGQSQRVAMGRALVRQPQVFLMDEPLSNLDAKLRVQMRAEIATLQQRLGVTTLYVTHDQVEAMTMGTRIAVLRKGVLQQIGPPQEIYDQPANLFVASFVGSPPMNLVKARIVQTRAGLSVEVGPDTFDLDASTTTRLPSLAGYAGREVALGVRPEMVSIGTTEVHGPVARLHAVLRLVEALGYESLVHLELAAEPTVHDAVLEVASDVDASAAASLLGVAGQRRAPVVARTVSPGLPAPGSAVETVVPQRAMYFFDLATGSAITTEVNRPTVHLAAASVVGGR